MQPMLCQPATAHTCARAARHRAAATRPSTRPGHCRGPRQPVHRARSCGVQGQHEAGAHQKAEGGSKGGSSSCGSSSCCSAQPTASGRERGGGAAQLCRQDGARRTPAAQAAQLHRAHRRSRHPSFWAGKAVLLLQAAVARAETNAPHASAQLLWGLLLWLSAECHRLAANGAGVAPTRQAACHCRSSCRSSACNSACSVQLSARA